MRAPAVDLQRYRSRRRRQEGQWLRQERATVRPGQRRDGRRRHLRLEGEVPPRSVATNARHPGVRSLARPGRRRGQRTRRARRPVLAAARFWLLWYLGFNMLVGVAVGFIALAGAAAETGVVVLNYLEPARAELKARASWRVGSSAVPTCRSVEHTSSLPSLMRTPSALFCFNRQPMTIFRCMVTIQCTRSESP